MEIRSILDLSCDIDITGIDVGETKSETKKSPDDAGPGSAG
jgi:hypothetical protein